MQIKGMVLTVSALVAGVAMTVDATAGVQCSAVDNYQAQYSQSSSDTDAVCAVGNGFASANNATGVLKWAVYGDGGVSSLEAATLSDNFTITGMGDSAYVIPITMTLDGSYDATGIGQSGFNAGLDIIQNGIANYGILYGEYDPSQGVDQFGTEGDALFTDVSSNKSDITATIRVYAYVSQNNPGFEVFVQDQSFTSGPSFSDFSHTAKLDIDLPLGLSFAPQTPDFLSAAPEPATWAMMLMGFGVLGAAMRIVGTDQGRSRLADVKVDNSPQKTLFL